MHALQIRRVPPIAWIIPALIVLIGLVTINSWLPDPLADYHAEQVRMMDNVAASMARTPNLAPAGRASTLAAKRRRL